MNITINANRPLSAVYCPVNLSFRPPPLVLCDYYFKFLLEDKSWQFRSEVAQSSKDPCLKIKENVWKKANLDAWSPIWGVMRLTDFVIKWMIYYLWELILRWLNSITNCVSKFPGLSSHLKLSLKSLCLWPESALSLSWPQPRGSSLSWAVQAPGPEPVTRGSITSRGLSTISCSRPGVWTVAGCRFLKIK